MSSIGSLRTIRGKTDGFGAQYQAILSGIAYCAYYNHTYVHTPMCRVEHGGNVNLLNEFIGLEAGVVEKDKHVVAMPFSHEVHYSSTPSIYYTSEVLEFIRGRYHSTRKPVLPEVVEIAVYIRRGDVDRAGNPRRFTSNETYVPVLDRLKERYPGRRILVFSEGNPEDFRDLGLEDTQLRLNEDIPTTFHSLVTAKVLVMAKSSFSYAAALINPHTVCYQNFWHKPLNHWDTVLFDVDRKG